MLERGESLEKAGNPPALPSPRQLYTQAPPAAATGEQPWGALVLSSEVCGLLRKTWTFREFGTLFLCTPSCLVGRVLLLGKNQKVQRQRSEDTKHKVSIVSPPATIVISCDSGGSVSGNILWLVPPAVASVGLWGQGSLGKFFELWFLHL